MPWRSYRCPSTTEVSMSSFIANRLSFPVAAAAVAECEVSVVLPCLNEAETVGICVAKAVETLKRLRIFGEVVVVDNGSNDGSEEIARRAGARVVKESRRGYGNALRRGIEEARGDGVDAGPTARSPRWA